MATERTQGQGKGGTGKQLEGVTDDGIEISASLDDEGEDSLEAGSEDMDSEDTDEEGSGRQRGGSGNFANDPERASEAGRKGGRH
jgi:hypothetical protein